MNVEERALVEAVDAAEPRIESREFSGVHRTLMFGYDVSRRTWHVYLKGGEIHKLIYDYNRIVSYEHGPSFECRQLRPDKRVFSESTDFSFARIMAERDSSLCFTTHDDEADALRHAGELGRNTPSPYYSGWILEELVELGSGSRVG